MIHRHLDIPEGTAVEDLGLAALDDLLDRGDLSDWAPLAKAILAEPEGRLANSVVGLCEAHPMYGTSVLWSSWIKSLRAAPSGRLGVSLAELRKSREFNQSQLAQRLGMSQSDLSKLERRKDVRISTLTAVVEGLGGTIRVTADFPDGTSAELAIGSKGTGRAQRSNLGI